jgi:hypothetical protein
VLLSVLANVPLLRYASIAGARVQGAMSWHVHSLLRDQMLIYV